MDVFGAASSFGAMPVSAPTFGYAAGAPTEEALANTPAAVVPGSISIDCGGSLSIKIGSNEKVSPVMFSNISCAL